MDIALNALFCIASISALKGVANATHSMKKAQEKKPAAKKAAKPWLGKNVLSFPAGQQAVK